MIWRETSSKSLCWANCLWVVATHCSRYSNLMQKIFWLYQSIDNVVLNIWNVSENVWRIRVERKKRWPLQLFLLHPPHLPLLPNCHPLSSVVIQKIWSPLQLLLLHAPHLPGQLVDHVQGDAEVHLGGWVKKMSSMEKEEASKFVMFRMGDGTLAHWRIGALAHWNNLALKLLLWGLKHFLQLSTFPLFNEIFNKIFNKIISFWGIWASTIFINFI